MVSVRWTSRRDVGEIQCELKYLRSGDRGCGSQSWSPKPWELRAPISEDRRRQMSQLSEAKRVCVFAQLFCSTWSLLALGDAPAHGEGGSFLLGPLIPGLKMFQMWKEKSCLPIWFWWPCYLGYGIILPNALEFLVIVVLRRHIWILC